MALQPDSNKNQNGQINQMLNDLHSEDDLVHRTAYDSLIGLGGEAVQPVIDAYPQSDGRARLSLIKAMGELGDARAVALLVDLMRNRDLQEYIFISSLAAKALGQIGQRGEAASDQAVAGLLETLRDDNVGSRRMAALVLGNVANAESVPGLTVALADADKQVRALAARALGLIGTGGRGADRAVPALIVRLADEDELSQPVMLNGHQAETVSAAAAWALRQIDTPDAKSALDKRTK